MDMVQIFAEISASYAIVKNCTVEFKLGIDSIEGEFCSGRLKTSITDAIHRIVLNNGRLSLRQIAKSLGINSSSVHTVLTDILGRSKLSARGVPRMLMSEHKLKRVDISKTLSDLLPG